MDSELKSLLQQILDRLKEIDDSVQNLQSSTETYSASAEKILKEQLQAIQNIGEDS